MKVGLLLMENLLTSLVKSVLIPLALTAAGSARDAGIQRNSLLGNILRGKGVVRAGEGTIRAGQGF